MSFMSAHEIAIHQMIWMCWACKSSREQEQEVCKISSFCLHPPQIFGFFKLVIFSPDDAD